MESQKIINNSSNSVLDHQIQNTLINGGWRIFGKTGNFVLQIIVFALLARILVPEDFGVIAVSNFVISLLGIFSKLGIGSSLIQSEDTSPLKIRNAFTLSLIFSMIMFTVIWKISPIIEKSLLSSENSAVIRGLSFTLIFSGIGIVAESLLIKKLAYKLITIVDLSSYFIGYCLIAIPLALQGYGVWSLVYGMVGNIAIRSLSFLIVNPHPIKPSLKKTEAKKIVSYGFGLSLTQISNIASFQGNQLIIARTLGTSPLGIFERAYKYILLPGDFVGNIGNDILFPLFSKYNQNLDYLLKMFKKGFSLLFTILFPVNCLLFILAPQVINVLLGNQWLAAATPFRILAIGATFRSIVTLIDALVKSTGAVYRSALRKIIFIPIILIATWIGHYLGLNGVAIGVTLSFLIYFLMMIFLAKKILNTKVEDLLEGTVPGIILGIFVFTTSLLSKTLIQFRFPHNQAMMFFIVTLVALITALFTIRYYNSLYQDTFIWLLKRILKALPEDISNQITSFYPFKTINKFLRIW